MRKLVKKIVAVATALTMTAAMGISAFAAGSYTFVGNPHLFGIDADEDPAGNNGWKTTAQDQKLADAGDGLYKGTFNCVTAGEYEFKVVADGDIFAWSYQLCLGNPEAAWADNQSQFKAKFEAGEYTVVMDPAKGFVVCVQNGKVCDYTVRYKSRDEDSANFVDPTVAAVKADGYEPQDFDADLAAFVEKAVALAPAAAEPETTTAAAAETTAAASAETTTAAASAETTAAKPVKTGDAAPVAVIATLFAAVAVVAVAAKKREA